MFNQYLLAHSKLDSLTPLPKTLKEWFSIALRLKLPFFSKKPGRLANTAPLHFSDLMFFHSCPHSMGSRPLVFFQLLKHTRLIFILTFLDFFLPCLDTFSPAHLCGCLFCIIHFSAQMSCPQKGLPWPPFLKEWLSPSKFQVLKSIPQSSHQISILEIMSLV